MMRKLLFFVSESIIGMRRSSLMIVVAKATIFVSLLVFGLFLLVNLNLVRFSDYIGSKLEVRVFLNQSLTKKEIHYFKSKVDTLSEVKSVHYVDRSDAWELFKRNYSSLDLNQFVDFNPLPHSLKIMMVDHNNVNTLIHTLNGFNYYVDDVVYGGGLADKLHKISRFVLMFGWIIVVLLSFATFLIVINTIKLTIMNRSEEITIMRLVGATDMFILGPFIMEGIILGLSSSLLAMGVIHIIMKFSLVKLNYFLPFMFSISSFEHLELIYVVLVFWGVSLGVLGAFFSIKATLKNTL
ncbi:hypothetical protein DID78_00790 [Candidatus Marinamargulisbacteria bacterium SCGC AG-343-D04]|nr:hypothetical protein DID78_00790 [Candidatus Marinamargulisbacteria bacterium SCGC AG-343-D04]